MKVIKIDLNKIEQNENSRAIYKESDLSELMHSMKQDGLLQPVGVMKLGSGKYEAVFGNRRIVAAQKLGWADIDANVLDLDGEDERDLVNLIENMKRQNVSVVEEGRIYAALISRGLMVPEIAARLGVNKIRVNTALDAVRHVPADLSKKVVNRVSGAKKSGTISASSYLAAANLRNSHGLNAPQFKELLNYAAKGRTSYAHMKSIAPLLKDGLDLDEAIVAAEKFDRVSLQVFVSSAKRKQIEKKTGKNISDLIYTLLESRKELGVRRKIARGPAYNATQHRHRSAYEASAN